MENNKVIVMPKQTYDLMVKALNSYTSKLSKQDTDYLIEHLKELVKLEVVKK